MDFSKKSILLFLINCCILNTLIGQARANRRDSHRWDVLVLLATKDTSGQGNSIGRHAVDVQEILEKKLAEFGRRMGITPVISYIVGDQFSKNNIRKKLIGYKNSKKETGKTYLFTLISISHGQAKEGSEIPYLIGEPTMSALPAYRIDNYGVDLLREFNALIQSGKYKYVHFFNELCNNKIRTLGGRGGDGSLGTKGFGGGALFDLLTDTSFILISSKKGQASKTGYFFYALMKGFELVIDGPIEPKVKRFYDYVHRETSNESRKKLGYKQEPYIHYYKNK
jgi:hypothetical protein